MNRVLMMSALSSVGLFWAAPALADDCTRVGDPASSYLSVYPRSSGASGSEDVPANVFFMGGGEGSFESIWSDASGEPLVLTQDPDLSEILAGSQQNTGPQAASRPEAPLTPGAVYTRSSCEGEGCARFTVGEEDVTAPGRAEVSDLEVLLIENGRDGGGFSCPDVDVLSMSVGGSDERAEDVDLLVLGFIAQTEALLSEETVPQLVFPLLRSASGELDPRRLNFTLGVSHSRQRDGAHFRKGAYCFALAFMDRAGNVGERSEPRCISTVDEGAPYVEVSVNSGCCAVPGGQAPGRPLLLWAAIGLVGFVLRSPRRRGA